MNADRRRSEREWAWTGEGVSAKINRRMKRNPNSFKTVLCKGSFSIHLLIQIVSAVHPWTTATKTNKQYSPLTGIITVVHDSFCYMSAHITGVANLLSKQLLIHEKPVNEITGLVWKRRKPLSKKATFSMRVWVMPSEDWWLCVPKLLTSLVRETSVNLHLVHVQIILVPRNSILMKGCSETVT